MKVQQSPVLKYLNLLLIQYPLGCIIDKNNHIIDMITEWFTEEKNRIIETPFITYSNY